MSNILYTNPLFFNDLPLLPGEEYRQQYLTRAYDVIQQHRRSVNQSLAIRLDLRFPKTYWLPDNEVFSNEYIQRFFRGLEWQLEQVRKAGKDCGRRVHPHCLRYIWCREYNQDGTKPHYHILLLFNKAAYRYLSKAVPGGDNLMNKIIRAWEASLGIHDGQGYGLVHVPEHPCYTIERDSMRGMAELFQRVSYLCKRRSKRLAEGYHCFGGSRG